MKKIRSYSEKKAREIRKFITYVTNVMLNIDNFKNTFTLYSIGERGGRDV